MKEYKPGTCGKSVWKDGIPYCKLSAAPNDTGSRTPCERLRDYPCMINVMKEIEKVILYGDNKNER